MRDTNIKSFICHIENPGYVHDWDWSGNLMLPFLVQEQFQIKEKGHTFIHIV